MNTTFFSVACILIAIACSMSILPAHRYRGGKTSTTGWVDRLFSMRNNSTPYSMHIIVGISVLLLWISSGWLIVGCMGGLVSALICYRVRLYRQRAQETTQNHHIVSVLTVLEGELQAGASLHHALLASADHCKDKNIKNIVSTTARRSILSPETAAHLMESSPILGLRQLAHAWSLSHTYGISLAAMTRHTRSHVEIRNLHEKELYAQLQGSIMSSWMLAGLPLIGVALGYLLGVNVVGFLLDTPLGVGMLSTGLMLESIGLWWSQRIISGALAV